MLAYAFHSLDKSGFKKVATENFHNATELCAAILDKALEYQIKKGLDHCYEEQSKSMVAVKGKIDITASIKEQSQIKRQLVCVYDEFSINSPINRIIKTTLNLLVKSNLRKDLKHSLREKMPYFDSVDIVDFHKIDWRIKYNKNNRECQGIVNVCYLIISGLLQNEENGRYYLADFLDEQRMCRLYEKFLLGYYRKEFPELHAAPSFISWQLDDGYDEDLPAMQSDIMLRYSDKILIIDAKYYKHTKQKRSEDYSKTLISGNLYQVFSYVKNTANNPKNSDKIVSGMLLYAKTEGESELNHRYQMSGNEISVKTLDLNCDFQTIRERLNRVAEEIL